MVVIKFRLIFKFIGFFRRFWESTVSIKILIWDLKLMRKVDLVVYLNVV